MIVMRAAPVGAYERNLQRLIQRTKIDVRAP